MPVEVQDEAGNRMTTTYFDYVLGNLGLTSDPVRQLVNSVDCLPLDALANAGLLGDRDMKLFDDATALYYTKLVPNGHYVVQGDPDGNNGVLDATGRLRQYMDPIEFGLPWNNDDVGWFGEVERTNRVYVGCDFTRVKPGQQPVSPDPLPGDPKRNC
jgi:hypothetical protein